ncbi:BON domain-containing protein [Curtobacterium sp. KT1]|uniref:BON domain-containing protein n=1 Tax=Curtobacterium sp. KT1 TaxID=3372858 RepID=UPI0037C059AF
MSADGRAPAPASPSRAGAGTSSQQSADAARSADVSHRIAQAMSDEASRRARDLLVIVSGDEIVVRGHVRSWSERDHIGAVALDTPGVRVVCNDLVLFDDAAVHGHLHHGGDGHDLGAGGCDV